VEETDFAFVVDSWIKSYRKREVRSGVQPAHYQKGQLALIKFLAAHTKVLVACDASQPMYIVGWGCARVSKEGEFQLHYVYVKEDYRNHGIGYQILVHLGYRQGRPIVASHWNFIARDYNLRHDNLFYNPYLTTLGAQYV